MMDLLAVLIDAKLQWGRNFIVAEIRYRVMNSHSPALLQWGRNFIVAEMSAGVAWDQQDNTRFNGAATLSLRKYRVNTYDPATRTQLQWGHNFIVAEMQ